MSDFFENQSIKLKLENGIVFAFFKSQDINMENAKTCVRERLRLSKEQKMPFFADIRDIKFFDKEARSYLSTEEATRGLTAGAILIDSKVQEVIGNFFLSFNKPKVPAKLFTSKDKALEWLEQYKIEQTGSIS